MKKNPDFVVPGFRFNENKKFYQKWLGRFQYFTLESKNAVGNSGAGATRTM